METMYHVPTRRVERPEIETFAAFQQGKKFSQILKLRFFLGYLLNENGVQCSENGVVTKKKRETRTSEVFQETTREQE